MTSVSRRAFGVHAPHPSSPAGMGGAAAADEPADGRRPWHWPRHGAAAAAQPARAACGAVRPSARGCGAAAGPAIARHGRVQQCGSPGTDSAPRQCLFEPFSVGKCLRIVKISLSVSLSTSCSLALPSNCVPLPRRALLYRSSLGSLASQSCSRIAAVFPSECWVPDRRHLGDHCLLALAASRSNVTGALLQSSVARRLNIA